MVSRNWLPAIGFAQSARVTSRSYNGNPVAAETARAPLLAGRRRAAASRLAGALDQIDFAKGPPVGGRGGAATFERAPLRRLAAGFDRPAHARGIVLGIERQRQAVLLGGADQLARLDRLRRILECTALFERHLARFLERREIDRPAIGDAVGGAVGDPDRKRGGGMERTGAAGDQQHHDASDPRPMPQLPFSPHRRQPRPIPPPPRAGGRPRAPLRARARACA